MAQTFGPPIAGMCLLSKTGVISGSRAGRSMQQQVETLRTSLAGDVARQRTALAGLARRLEAQQGTTLPLDYQRQLGALSQQSQIVTQTEQQHNARLQQVQLRAQQQVDGALNTALSRVLTLQRCSVIFERDTAYGWNNAMDITPAVTREMDGILQAVSL
ncbi:OmpH family outer membrane protein [Sphingopyxis sp. LARHCG72]